MRSWVGSGDLTPSPSPAPARENLTPGIGLPNPMVGVEGNLGNSGGSGIDVGRITGGRTPPSALDCAMVCCNLFLSCSGEAGIEGALDLGVCVVGGLELLEERLGADALLQ